MQTALLDQKERLKHLFLQHGVKWKEGIINDRIPRWIVDAREVILTYEGIKLVVDVLYEQIKDDDIDIIAGQSVAAEPLVSALVLHCARKGKPVSGAIVRKQENNYGLRNMVEGPLPKRKKTVMVDDVINSGNSMMRALAKLRGEGCEITKIITLVDFKKSGRVRLEENIPFTSIFSLEELGLDTNSTEIYSQPSLKELPSIQKKTEFKFHGKQLQDILVHKNLVLVATTTGSLHCFDLSSQKEKWHCDLGETFASPLFLDEDTVLVAASSALRRSLLTSISLKKGTILNRFSMKGEQVTRPVRWENQYYVGASSSELHCLDTMLSSLWVVKTKGKITSPFSVDEQGNVFFSSAGDAFYSYDSKGNLLWKKRLGEDSIMPAVVTSTNVYLITDTNVVFSLEKENGLIKWFKELKNNPLTMSIHGSYLFIGCDHGYVIILDENGEVVNSSKVGNHGIFSIKKKETNVVIHTSDGKRFLLEDIERL